MRHIEPECGQESPRASLASALHVRWMIRRDFPEVLEIERDSFEFPWAEHDFIGALRARNCIGMVCEVEGLPPDPYAQTSRPPVAGFMVYELHKRRLQLLNFAVDYRFRRHGVGTSMIEKLKCKLSDDRRSQITLEVRESNLRAQLFFRAMGFRAVNVLRSFYEDTAEDAYLFRYRFR